MTTSVSVRKLIVGGTLRRYRQGLGLTLGDAAAILDCDRSKLSRIETGQRGIRRAELLGLLEEYGAGEKTQEILAAIADDRKTWWRKYTPSLPPAWSDLAALLSCASAITVYEAQQIPLLLQTGSYEKIVIDADRTLNERASSALPEMLADLRKTVMQPGGATLRFIVGEAAFRGRAGGVMREQIARLGTGDGVPELRVLPFAAMPRPALWAASMTLLEFGDSPDIENVVHLGGPRGGVFLLGEDEVISCARQLSELRGMALAGDTAARLIAKAASGS